MNIFEELEQAVLTATPELGRKVLAVKSAKKYAGSSTWHYHVLLEGGEEKILIAGDTLPPVVKIF